VQCNTRVGRIEQTIECPPAGLHTDGHRRLGEAILLHGGFDLIGEDLLDGFPYGPLAAGGFVEERRELVGAVDRPLLCRKWHILARAAAFASDLTGVSRNRSGPGL
jgi:hypothetical protein